MLYQVLALFLAVAIWAALHLTGTESHTADGIIFFGLVAVEGLLIWFGSRSGGSLNDRTPKP